jgi:hypothetical protein
MSLLIFLGPLILGAVLWLLLDRHERRRADRGLPRHSGMHLIAASFGLLLALFAGGCGALFGFNADGKYVDFATVAIFTAPALLLGGSVFWLAMARGMKPIHLAAAFVAGAVAAGGVMLMVGLLGAAPLAFASIWPVVGAALAGGVAAVVLAKGRLAKP